MKRYVLFLVVGLLPLAGCAGHYYTVRGDNVHIHLKRPTAEVIYFASSLDGYELHKTKRIDDMTWEVIVPAGAEFRYFYIVDGVVYLPPCRFKEQDDFGSENCIYIPEM